MDERACVVLAILALVDLITAGIGAALRWSSDAVYIVVQASIVTAILSVGAAILAGEGFCVRRERGMAVSRHPHR